MSHHSWFVIFATLAFVVSHGQAAARTTVAGKLDQDGLAVVLLESDGRSVSSATRRFALATSATAARLLVLDSDTSVRGPVVLGIQSGGRVYSVRQAARKQLCGDATARAVTRLKPKGRRLVLGALSVGEHVAYPNRRLRAGILDTASGLARVDGACVPVGAGRLGVGAEAAGQTAARAAHAGAEPAPGAEGDPGGGDPDGDGMPDAFDADDDGDTILDNDDEDSRGGGPGPGGESAKKFWVFSNFHLDLESSLNANAMTVTKADVDAALVRTSGLAFQVAGGGSAPDVELDCGTLPYCIAGGTGRTREPYPSGVEFPEGSDADGDGLGTITAGPSGDFQFAPFGDAPAGHPASDLLRPGDVYRQQYVAPDGTTVEVPGMLNFVFHTTPAVKTVETGVRTYEVTYPVAPGSPGTRENPFHVPTAGDVSVTLTVWRPQRPGIAAAGEAPLMDMGNLRLVTNLPQGPCGPGVLGCATGPGLCPATVYTTTDPGLTGASDGLQDTRGDQPADPANTFAYTIDLSACVEPMSGAWTAGQSLMVPLQMMNVYGDNAAQNLFFLRDDS